MLSPDDEGIARTAVKGSLCLVFGRLQSVVVAVVVIVGSDKSKVAKQRVRKVLDVVGHERSLRERNGEKERKKKRRRQEARESDTEEWKAKEAGASVKRRPSLSVADAGWNLET